MKKSINLLIILLIVLSFFIGIYIYRISNIGSDIEKIAEVEEEKLIDDECTMLEELNSVNANSAENKITLSTNLTIKILYKECNHVIKNTEKITDEELINLTEEEFKEKYSDWEVQKFTPSEIVIYKEVNDFCNEHYKIKEKDGYIAIYKIDKNGNEELNGVTDISTSYLTNGDIQKIKNGIMVYSKKELNKTLEDFE